MLSLKDRGYNEYQSWMAQQRRRFYRMVKKESFGTALWSK